MFGYLFLIVIYFLFPLIGVFPLLYYSLKKHYCVFLTLLLVSFSFSLLAFCADSAGKIDTDIVRYRSQYDAFVYNSYGIGFSVNIVFDSISWLFAHYISNNVRTIGLVWVFVSNFFLMLSVRILLSLFVKGEDSIDHLKYYIAVILIVPLAMQSELLKQVTVMTMVLYAVCRSIAGRNRIVSWCWAVIALFVHPATAVCFFPLSFFRKQWFQDRIGLFFCFSLVLSQIDILAFASHIPFPVFIDNLLGLHDKIEHYSSFSSWGGSWRFYIVFFFYSCLVLNLLRAIKKPHFRDAIIALITVLCVLLINMSSNHNFARLTNTLYPFFVMALIVGTVIGRIRKKELYCVVVGLLMLSNIIQYSSNMSNEYYLTYMDNDYFRLFTSNVLDFLTYE